MGLFSKLFGKKAAPAPEYVEPGQVYKFVVTTPTQVLEIEAEGFSAFSESSQTNYNSGALAIISSSPSSATFTKTRPKTLKGVYTWPMVEVVAFIPGPFISIIRAGEVK